MEKDLERKDSNPDQVNSPRKIDERSWRNSKGKQNAKLVDK